MCWNDALLLLGQTDPSTSRARRGDGMAPGDSLHAPHLFSIHSDMSGRYEWTPAYGEKTKRRLEAPDQNRFCAAGVGASLRILAVHGEPGAVAQLPHAWDPAH